MRPIPFAILVLIVMTACTRPSVPEPGGGALGDLINDNQSDRGDSSRGEPEGTPRPKKEK